MGELRAFMFEFVYRNPVAKGEEGKARSCSAASLNTKTTPAEPDKLPPEFQDIRMEEGVERAVCDYICRHDRRFTRWSASTRPSFRKS